MADLTHEAVASFISELDELSRRHGIVIGGCGCCGSPYLVSDGDPAGRYVVTTPSDPDRQDWENLEWRNTEEQEEDEALLGLSDSVHG